MRINVCLFAGLRDIVGASRVEYEVPEGSTVDGVWQVLVQEFPALGPHRGALAVAVNEEFARFTTPVCDGGTVALLPPVSGG